MVKQNTNRILMFLFLFSQMLFADEDVQLSLIQTDGYAVQYLDTNNCDIEKANVPNEIPDTKRSEITFLVLIRNVSKKKLAFYSHENMWGSHSLEFEAEFRTGQKVKINWTQVVWRSNEMTFISLMPGESYAIPISLLSGGWSNIGILLREETFAIKAAFEQNPPKETEEIKIILDQVWNFPYSNFWSGKVESAIYPIMVLSNKWLVFNPTCRMVQGIMDQEDSAEDGGRR